MMSLDTIQHMNREAQERAAVDNTRPFIVCAQDIAAWKNGNGLPLPFPFIGDHEPEGYEPEGDALFVDISGFGQDDEPALSMRQMLDALKPSMAYALTELGQFQGYLQPYRVVTYRHAENK